MGKAKNMDYISQSFEDRIEVNLANISRKASDKITLIGIQFYPATFKCELCGHDPCLYAFTIKNFDTNIIMKVGSECVNHFVKGKTNIDLATGLQKRVKSIVRKMRRYMKNTLEDEYKEMPREQKREIIVRLFMKHQVMEALKVVGDNKKSLLSKEDVLEIIRQDLSLR